MDKRYVTDNIKLTGRCGAHTKSRSASRRALAATLLISSAALAGGVSAETISINASQNPDNKIEITGDFKPSVEVSTTGLKIEIPGVNITLTCEGAEVGGETPCTLNLASGGSDSSPPGNSSGGNGNDGSGSGDGAIAVTTATVDTTTVTSASTGDGSGDGSGSGDDAGDGDGSSDGAGDGNGATGDGVDDGNGSGDDSGASNASGIDCSKGPDQPFVSDSAYEANCNPDGTPKQDASGSNDGGQSSGSGFATNPDPDPVDTCGPGYDPACAGAGDGSDSVAADTRDLFSESRDIADYSVERGSREGDEAIDFGSAGAFGSTGRKKTVTLEKGKVGVIGFTLAPPATIKEYCAAGKDAAPSYFNYDSKDWEERCNTDDNTPKAGEQPEQRLDRNTLRLAFSESTTQAGGNFHLWLSEEKDGEPIPNCGFSTFPEGKWLLSVGINEAARAKDCNLAEGKSYFMMVAFCETVRDDVNCKASDAQTGLRSGNMSLDPGWYLAE